MPQDAMRWYTRGRGVGSAVKGIARAILTFTFTHEATARGTGRYTGSQPGHSLHSHPLYSGHVHGSGARALRCVCMCVRTVACEDVKRVSDRMYMGDKLLGIAWPCGIALVYEFYARETSIYRTSRDL